MINSKLRLSDIKNHQNLFHWHIWKYIALANKKVFNYIVSTLPIRKKSNSDYYSDAQFYESILDKYNQIDSYLKLLNELENKKILKTAKGITLLNRKTTNETDYKFILKKYGKSQHKSGKIKSQVDSKILFYKQMLGCHRANLEMHFYNDTLFFTCYKFSNLKEDGKMNIMNIVKEKYLNGLVFNKNKQYIVDSDENVILFTEEQYFEINYVALNSNFFNKINAQKNEMEAKVKSMIDGQEKILFERL